MAPTLVARLFALCLAAAVAVDPLDLGLEYPLHIYGNGSAPFSQLIERTGASFISVHFVSMDLPAGATLKIASLDGAQEVSYQGRHTDLFSATLATDSVRVTYTAPSYETAAKFEIDHFITGKPASKLESVCGKDDSKPSMCYAESESAKFKASKAVARLVIGGRFLCTGWLVGSKGHMMTNWHCIKDAAKAANVQVEFGAMCPSCDDARNDRALKCEGVKVASSVHLLVSSKRHDFALVQLNTTVDLAPYGHLQLRASGPVLNETVYIPQHPSGRPQRLAIVTDDDALGTITSLTEKSCDYADVLDQDFVGHRLDTQGGSSGSPILTTLDNTVVAIHNCGSDDGCTRHTNGGVRIDNVLAYLRANNVSLPNDAVVGDLPSPTPSTPTPTPAPTAETPAPTTETPTTPSPAPTTETPMTPEPTPCPSPSPTRPSKAVQIRTKRGKYLSEWNTGLFADVWRGNLNELFEVDAVTQSIKSVKNQQCLDAYRDHRHGRYRLHTYACDANNANQKWIVGNGQIKHATHDNLCLDVDPTNESHEAQVWTCFEPNDNQQFDVVSLQP
ncbi:hypothetical protein SDRG_16838 [Saprolegnia diclina VS20]|uniref:Ricin B lectin domain-containing protein n=1 Tax=Saprolegnia diclina (strain VS20) TaxID=1156394 RepID=T0PIT5_SAPDV|nr:hypothetical protein SDRG_16838 [Saprolegnia diclina VS20]EQC25284.1 hypothetical protein SDRG_16838 [Saprolegnia diclina VS20]|eukprot:XP_008621282.1 hypothetical protein SDRG_16838 [Saprolegnia diclina VS20]